MPPDNAKRSVQNYKSVPHISEAMASIRRDGAIVISGLLTDSEISELKCEVLPHFERAKFCEGAFFGYKTKRVHSLIAKSEMCRKLALHPFILEIMNGVLGPFCEKIQLNLTQGIQIWPGEDPQFLHRDDSMFPMNPKTHEFMANVMLACSEFTQRNGATVLTPGSHRWEDKTRRPIDDETTQAEMEPGDVLLYLGSIIHAGGANRSTAPRTGIALGYCLGWLRQYENQYLAAPPAIAQHFSPALQELLGYESGRTGMMNMQKMTS